MGVQCYICLKTQRVYKILLCKHVLAINRDKAEFLPNLCYQQFPSNVPQHRDKWTWHTVQEIGVSLLNLSKFYTGTKHWSHSTSNQLHAVQHSAIWQLINRQEYLQREINSLLETAIYLHSKSLWSNTSLSLLMLLYFVAEPGLLFLLCSHSIKCVSKVSL